MLLNLLSEKRSAGDQTFDEATGAIFLGNQIVGELFDERVIGVLELTAQRVAGDAADEAMGEVARFLF